MNIRYIEPLCKPCHPHRDLIILWANDPSLEVEVRVPEGNWTPVSRISWIPEYEYRLKPQSLKEEIQGKINTLEENVRELQAQVDKL